MSPQLIIIIIVIVIYIFVVMYLYLSRKSESEKKSPTEKQPDRKQINIHSRSKYLLDMKSKIFPVRMLDIKLKLHIIDEEYYSKIVKLCPTIPTYDQMVYLLKYKKFMERKDVYSMCDVNEVEQLHLLMEHVIRNQVTGDIVETGTWRGGMCMMAKAIIKDLEPLSSRKIYLFDTFKYFPSPTDVKNSPKDTLIHSVTKFLFENMQSVDDVRNNFKRFDLLDDNIHLIEGLFSNTVPKTKIDSIAILRLDSDYYDSTMLVLEHYYKKIVRKGFIIIDDWNNTFLDCKSAVTDFRNKYGITNKITDTHGGAVWWQI